MKSNVTEPMVINDYPKLMKSITSGRIALFDQPKVGVIVHSDDYPSELGGFDGEWDMANFEDFNGTVELSNQ